ncbi:hypothetical protein [Thermostichus sp. MS-CIW-30]
MYQLGRKRKDYARAGVSYYAVYDRTAGVASPLRQLRELQGSPLALFQRRGGEFVPFASTWLEDKGLRPANAKGLRPANAIGLGLTLWQRSFEVVNTEWLRWCDREGQVLPTGEEKAALEQQRAEAERQRAEALLELLRSHGKGLRPANAIAPPAA